MNRSTAVRTRRHFSAAARYEEAGSSEIGSLIDWTVPRRMDLAFGEFIESIPRPHPSVEIIDFVRVPSDLIMRSGDQLRVTFYESRDLPAS